jgi:phage terminase small subunit
MAGHGGRQAKPWQLHVLEGNKNHLTKQELQDRKDNEIRFGTQDFQPSDRLKKNKVALKKWNELIGLYTDGHIEFVSIADQDLLERYCFTHADYIQLLDVKDSAMLDLGKRVNKETGKKLSELQIYGAISKTIEKSINKKLQLLLSMDMQLILTPLAKLKNVGRKPGEDKEDPLVKKGFGNV